MSDTTDDLRPLRLYYTMARFFTALWVLLYAIVSLNVQGPLLAERDAALGSLNAFSLASYFYSVSTGYRITIGLIALTGATLLLFRRTALLGALILLPILLNILFIAIFFGGSIWVVINAFVLCTLLAFMIASHWPELAPVVWPRFNRVYGAAASRTERMLRWALLVIAVVATTAISLITRPGRNPLEGRWVVDRIERYGTPAQSVTAIDSIGMIYIEPNRAGTGVVRMNNELRRVRLRIDTTAATLRITTSGTRINRIIFNGSYARHEDGLLLTGRTGRDSIGIALRQEQP